MLIDRLVDHVTVEVEPFAACLLHTGWRLRLPGNPGTVLHFAVEGTGTLRSPGAEWPLAPLTLAVVPAGMPHAVECGTGRLSEEVIRQVPECEGMLEIEAGATGRCDLTIACGLVQVTYGDSLDLFGRLDRVIVADLSGFPQAGAAFAGILAEQRQPGEGSTALMRALMTQCLIYLLRSVSGEGETPLPWLAALEDPELSPALELLLSEPAAHHTLDGLAAAAAMSRSSFAARFHAAFGQPPLAFLHEIRMRRAAQLLERSRTSGIEQIAHAVGMASRSHFSEAFKTRFGVTPSAYRASTK